MRLIYHPVAGAELIEAARAYDEKVAGLGDRFLAEFDSAILKIIEAPHRYPMIGDDLRRFVMQSFPYGIYYRIEGDRIRVLVIKHHARHPNYWRDRLGP